MQFLGNFGKIVCCAPTSGKSRIRYCKDVLIGFICNFFLLQVLEEAGIWSQIKRLAGSNTGAIMAALLGVGYKSHDIQQFFSKSVQSIFEGIFCFFIKLKWPKNFYVGSTWEFSWTMWFYFGRGTWRTQDLFTIELNIFKYEYLDLLQTIGMLNEQMERMRRVKKIKL